MALSDAQELINTLRSHPAEAERFEFKKDHFEPENFGEYVSALANTAMLYSQNFAYIVYCIENDTHNVVGTKVRLKSEKVGGEIFEHWLTRFLSPKINVSFESCDYDGNHVEIATIEPAYDRPVRFKNVSYIRINSDKKRLDEFPEKERALWVITARHSFEEGIAATHLSRERFFKKFLCRELSEKIYQGAISNDNIIENFLHDGLIIDNLQGGYDVTNLFALCAAKDLSLYKSVAHKAPRVITYKGSTKVVGSTDVIGARGYIVTFPKLLKYIMDKVATREVIKHGIRSQEYLYPEFAVREFLANALIHQDMISIGGRPTIEIYTDKIQITNPGRPIVSIDRIIDAPARSRNEKLAGLMRKAGYCEERGSGIDRAIMVIEEVPLAPPIFQVVEDSFTVTLFNKKEYVMMSKEEKIVACYQHAVLKYIRSEPMNNSSLRGRLGLNKNQYPLVSGVIKDAIEDGWIRPLDEDQGNRVARYVPFWA